MRIRRFLAMLPLAAACMLCASCYDSTSPLSAPDKAKPDARLAGVWRLREDNGDVTYYHVGRAGGRLPEGFMLAVAAKHNKDGTLERPSSVLVFPSTVGDKPYLNVLVTSEEYCKTLMEKGWKAGTSERFFLILKYRVDGDTLCVWPMNNDAKRKAIEAGKIKGEVKSPPHFTVLTDSSENLAKFVSATGDGLFNKDAVKLERVK